MEQLLSQKKKTCYKIIGTHLWISQTHGNTKKERKNSEAYPCNDCSRGLEYSRDRQISETCWPTSLPNPCFKFTEIPFVEQLKLFQHRTWVWFPASTRWLTTRHNSSSREFSVILWPTVAVHARGMRIYMLTKHSLTCNKIKYFKNIYLRIT